MTKKLIKSPIKPRTKEELLRQREVARKRKIVIEQFYPALVKATISIDEAKMLIQAATSLIMEEVLQTMKDRKFSEISSKIAKKLDGDGVRQGAVADLMHVLDKENLYVAREIIEGMTRAIDTTVTRELRDRSLETLKPQWDIMLNT